MAEAVPIEIPAGERALRGDLTVPARARSLVIFAHGSGSGRLSPRNRFVAQTLQRAGLATLLLDLLTEREEVREQAGARLRFDVEALAKRLAAASDWASERVETCECRQGYFGASTGAAAALIAAAAQPARIGAVVSRGGRPDLASASVLQRVRAPTLLIVGGDDDTVLQLNEQAYEHLRVERRLEVIPGATHLFEEPGTLEQAASLARDWFSRWLDRRSDARTT
jgi:putative phosphoribosyl transferase